MKIVQVIPHFGLGGAEIMCENLVYELRRLGHEVIVISMHDRQTVITERLNENGIDVVYLGKKDGLDLSVYKKLRAIFKREKPDVIHTHMHAAKYVFPLAALMRIRVVHTLHSIALEEAPRSSRKINKIFFKHFGVIPVALSEAIQKTVVEEYRLKAENIPIVLNGINLSNCIPKEDYVVNGKIKILHVGRFYEPKNHEGLLKAFKIFYDVHPDSELWLIGDGEKKTVIEEYVKANGLEMHVKFWGAMGSVHSHLHEADIFTLPSHYEGIPMALIEAMGTALPIVATAVGGVPDMLTNEESALLTAVDSQEVADALLRLADNMELRKTLGKNAFVRAATFSSEGMANRYIAIYQGEHK